MSASRFPWNVLGLTSVATEKEVRRAYATRLKQLNTATHPDEFQELRRAYDFALMHTRLKGGERETETGEPEEQPEGQFEDGILNLAPPPDLAVPFETMQSLVEARDYSVTAWQRLLNDPLLDARNTSAAFEYALVSALSENELTASDTLSAGKEWRDLIESRYAWMSDGLRYARQFPLHTDLRQALVELARSSRPIPYSSVPERPTLIDRLGTIALVLFVLILLSQVVRRASEGGVTP